MKEARHKVAHTVWFKKKIEMSRIGKSRESQSRLVVDRGWCSGREEEWGMTANG
jgi:hypothetical protein